jgi:hypothetical protein
MFLLTFSLFGLNIAYYSLAGSYFIAYSTGFGSSFGSSGMTILFSFLRLNLVNFGAIDGFSYFTSGSPIVNSFFLGSSSGTFAVTSIDFSDFSSFLNLFFFIVKGFFLSSSYFFFYSSLLFSYSRFLSSSSFLFSYNCFLESSS